MPQSCGKVFDVKLFNIILLGICFMILFSAELAALNIQKTIISSIHDENANFNMEGYFLHGISYTLYASFLWLAPSIVSLTGPRLGMFLAGASFMYYLLAFNVEKEWAIYSGCVIKGIGAAVLWTAENKFLMSNSTPETRSRNISIFWFFYSSSEFYGNLFLYFQLQGKKSIDASTRHMIMHAMSVLSGLALVLFFVLRPATENKQSKQDGPIIALKKTWSIFTSCDIKILSITFLYAGLVQAFAFGVYSPSIGFTLGFGENAKQLVAVSGIFLGMGEMIGGGLQVLLSRIIHKLKHARFGIMLFGFVLHLTAFICIYLNLPDNAVFGNTYDASFINHSIPLAVLCSLLLGLADCCLNTQVYALLAVMHPDSGAQVCALYKFSKAVVKAASFYSSNHFGLHTHLNILIPTSILGVLAYLKIDKKMINMSVVETELHEQSSTQINNEHNN